ncbi:MAG: hypothetical protein II017_00080, partial [Erysipelotrichaceae bacterium]|nr:hypothetical protein [Erysipelotrichaceae bacterium]
LSNLLFDADKRATEITRTLSQSQAPEQNQAPKQPKKQTQDISASCQDRHQDDRAVFQADDHDDDLLAGDQLFDHQDR